MRKKLTKHSPSRSSVVESSFFLVSVGSRALPDQSYSTQNKETSSADQNSNFLSYYQS